MIKLCKRYVKLVVIFKQEKSTMTKKVNEKAYNRYTWFN